MLRIAAWQTYQHYRDRNPPWIKLHVKLLDSYDFGRLRDASKAHAVGLMLLAARTENHFPEDPAWIASKINATAPVDLGCLVACHFLETCPCEQCATKPLADRKHTACVETETETETEKARAVDRSPGNDSKPSPSAPARAPRRPKITDPDFGTFYEHYPRHEARAEAELAWWQTRDRRPPLANVLATLALLDTSEPRFIPRPATWLRAGRWADERPRNGATPPKPQQLGYNNRAGQLLSEADAVEASDPELAAILREDAGFRSRILPAPIQTED